MALLIQGKKLFGLDMVLFVVQKSTTEVVVTKVHKTKVTKTKMRNMSKVVLKWSVKDRPPNSLDKWVYGWPGYQVALVRLVK